MESYIPLIPLMTPLAAVVAPLLLAWLLGKQRTRERIEDYKRQDQVAEQVAQVAKNAKITTDSTDKQLRQIHTLVNSDMTAARQSELEQTRLTLTMLKRLVENESPNAEDEALIETTEARI